MLRKMSIVLAVIALGMSAIQTDALAREGGGGGVSHGGGFGVVPPSPNTRAGLGAVHSGLETHPGGQHSRDDHQFRRGWIGPLGGWCDDWPYNYDQYYGYCF